AMWSVNGKLTARGISGPVLIISGPSRVAATEMELENSTEIVLEGDAGGSARLDVAGSLVKKGATLRGNLALIHCGSADLQPGGAGLQIAVDLNAGSLLVDGQAIIDSQARFQNGGGIAAKSAILGSQEHHRGTVELLSARWENSPIRS
ncbi:MAG: hypothetical protein O3C21_08590, partial [Verrucomicrobia bacterium]|nr:hypothetical protein [Verrucomicrobiota bacterium]